MGDISNRPFPTVNYGNIDLDWFLTVAAVPGAWGSAFGEFVVYPAGKISWSLLRILGRSPEGTAFTLPNSDPNEKNAIQLLRQGKTFNELWPSEWRRSYGCSVM